MTLKECAQQIAQSETVNRSAIAKLRLLCGVLNALSGVLVGIALACLLMHISSALLCTNPASTDEYLERLFGLVGLSRVLCMVELLLIVVAIVTGFYKQVFSLSIVWFGVVLYPTLLLLIKSYMYIELRILLHLERTIFLAMMSAAITLSMVKWGLSFQTKKLSKQIKKEELENE